MYAAPRQSASPYDDAWRTLTVKASRLLIPMVNEAFGEHFSDTAEVVLSQNEHLIAGLGGETEKRITDTNFSVSDYAAFAGGNPLGDEVIISDGPVRKHYIFECESKPVTDRILIRIMEYAVASGLENALAEERDAIFLTIPQTAVLSLRCTENTPDKLRIIIRTFSFRFCCLTTKNNFSRYRRMTNCFKGCCANAPIFSGIWTRLFRLRAARRLCWMITLSRR